MSRIVTYDFFLKQNKNDVINTIRDNKEVMFVFNVISKREISHYHTVTNHVFLRLFGV